MNNQTRNIIAGTLAAATIISGVLWISQKPSPNTAQDEWSAGALEAQETFYDFGTISMAAGKVSHIFTVKNTSPQLVAVSKLFTSCMCTIATIQHNGKKLGPFGMQGHGIIPVFNEVLLPGETITITVTFDPAAHGPSGTGMIRRVVTVETNSQTKPKLEISFAANVIP